MRRNEKTNNILGMCETRWTGADIKIDEDFKIIYSGGEDRQRGVAIIFDRKTSKSVQVYWAVSDRVLLVKLSGRPFSINIIQVYAPTGESSEDSVEEFYNDLETVLKKCENLYQCVRRRRHIVCLLIKRLLA